MTTQISIVNNMQSQLSATSSVTPSLASSDWGINNDTVPPLLDQPILWMNRDEGITDGKTWTFTTTLMLGSVVVLLQEQVTGTFTGSTIQIRIVAGTQETPWSTSENISLTFPGQDGHTYSVTGTFLGNGLSYDNVRFSVSEKVLPQIDHIIVLMMENRSFDNLLGWLYDPSHPPARNIPAQPEPGFNGLAGGSHANSNPGVNGGAPVQASRGTTSWPLKDGTVAATAVPTPDPGEEFQHVAVQLGNDMAGFLGDYLTQVNAAGAPANSAAQIMQSYSPEQVPMLSGLARNFAVSDAWFASVPSQTWPNRSFLLTGSSYGQVNNTSWPWKLTTIFDVLGGQNIPWRVYNDGPYPSLVKTLFAESYWDNETNFGSIDDFQTALNTKTLPPFTFLEPSFGIVGPIGRDESYHPPYDIRPAEVFLGRIYNMIARSGLAERTLFLVLFDEHGGTYDHVQPPDGAKPPSPCPVATDGTGYDFSTFGVRVPALAISSYIPAGTVFRSPTSVPLDHTAVLATVRDWLGLQAAFARRLPSPRIASAPTLASLLTETTPRPWPALDTTELEAQAALVQSQPVPDDLPLHDQQQATLMMATIQASGRAPTPGDWQKAQTHLRTVGDARRQHVALAPHLPLK